MLADCALNNEKNRTTYCATALLGQKFLYLFARYDWCDYIKILLTKYTQIT